MIKTAGSICSGIEAASVAWKKYGLDFKWFSEIASFPSRVLDTYYPDVPNLGDMNDIPNKIINQEIDAPDLICGGTPCQAFSFAGLQNGLNDDRGNLTLKFVDIINSNDKVRLKENKKETIVFWENVEGVLKDKTNAFGCLVSYLAGYTNAIDVKKWPNAGVIRGPKRNVAWRLLDAKYFGVPQQRKRLYLLAGGKDFYPENILFEEHKNKFQSFPKFKLEFNKDGHQIQIFREYTDCLYAAYGTKWNGNAAAYNGSLFVVQDSRIRRLTPLETERLMGFPDNYTCIPSARNTTRFQATGNSWVVPVVEWIGKRIINDKSKKSIINEDDLTFVALRRDFEDGDMILFDNDVVSNINVSQIPENPMFKSMYDIIDVNPDPKLYISPVGCYGIIRRKNERKIKINSSLEKILFSISSTMTPDEIEKRSRVQKRGKYSESDNIDFQNNIKIVKKDNITPLGERFYEILNSELSKTPKDLD